MSLTSIAKSAITDQLNEIVDTDTDTLIDILDIDEGTVDEIRKALTSWVRSDFGNAKSNHKQVFSSRRHSVKVSRRS